MRRARRFGLVRGATVVGLAASFGVLGAGAAGAGAGAGGAATPVSSPSPSYLVLEAAANATAKGWTHEVITSTVKGRTSTVTGDAGSTEGRQMIVSDGARAKVIVIGTTAYIEGNAKGIDDYFGLPKVDPNKWAGKWISLTSTDSGFSDVSSAVTLSSTFSALSFTGPFTGGTLTKVNGRKVLMVHGFVPGPTGKKQVKATFSLTSRGTVLPVELQASRNGTTETVVWSRWGQAVTLAAPAHSTPIDSL
jgi:hypothetical protein